MQQSLDDEPVDGAAFTCRFTAALRHVESTCVGNPVLTDPLAPQLCGSKALLLAQQELANLQAQQGPGKHLRVPARTRLIDDQILDCIQALQPPTPHLQPPPVSLQVVSLGCGMDTRPWRLPQLSTSITWFDVDQPQIAQLKTESLAAASAQTIPAPHSTPPPQFPLYCGAYHMLGADLSQVPLAAVLLPAGFLQHVPTIWVLEAVIYYMPLEAAAVLLKAMSRLSAPGSQLILTCVDNELLEASRQLDSTHVFSNLWYFDDQELCSCPGYADHWRTIQPPKPTKELALSRLGADTYVALYGGAECLMVAELAQQQATT